MQKRYHVSICLVISSIMLVAQELSAYKLPSQRKERKIYEKDKSDIDNQKKLLLEHFTARQNNDTTNNNSHHKDIRKEITLLMIFKMHFDRIFETFKDLLKPYWPDALKRTAAQNDQY